LFLSQKRDGINFQHRCLKNIHSLKCRTCTPCRYQRSLQKALARHRLHAIDVILSPNDPPHTEISTFIIYESLYLVCSSSGSSLPNPSLPLVIKEDSARDNDLPCHHTLESTHAQQTGLPKRQHPTTHADPWNHVGSVDRMTPQRHKQAP
jgi:hypothetical protein